MAYLKKELRLSVQIRFHWPLLPCSSSLSTTINPGHYGRNNKRSLQNGKKINSFWYPRLEKQSSSTASYVVHPMEKDNLDLTFSYPYLATESILGRPILPQNWTWVYLITSSETSLRRGTNKQREVFSIFVMP